MSTYDNPFSDEHIIEPYSVMWAARWGSNSKLKKLALQMVTKKTSVEKLQQLEERLDEILDILDQEKDLCGRLAWVEDEDDLGNYRVFSREITPVAGHSSPVAPPMHMWFDEEKKESYGRVTCNWLYEGPPNCVHGGIVSALFDEFLGCTQLLSGKAGATGSLSLKYHNPTPLNVELRLEGKLKAVHGRKILCEGNMYAGDTLTVSAEGLFVCIEEGVMNLSKRNTNKD
jgi:hypothetical protein